MGRCFGRQRNQNTEHVAAPSESPGIEPRRAVRADEEVDAGIVRRGFLCTAAAVRAGK